MNQEIVQVLNSLQNYITPASKQTLEIVIQVAHYQAISHILIGFACLIAAFLICSFGSWHIRKLQREYKIHNKNGNFIEDEVWPAIYALFLIISSASFTGFGLCMLCNIYNWVGLVNPKVYLAYQIVHKYFGN